MPMSTQRRSGSGPVLRSLSPCGRLATYTNSTPSRSSSSSFVASTSSSFSSPVPSTFFNSVSGTRNSSVDNQSHAHHYSHHRSASPTRVNLYTSSSSFSFSLDNRSISPNRSITVAAKKSNPISLPKKTCMCSPTTHPGSFRCSLHKNSRHHPHQRHGNGSNYVPNRLNMMRSAMKNSLVRIGGVEGEWVKRALTALIRPSSHQQRRRADFQPRPSRLSVMSRASDVQAF